MRVKFTLLGNPKTKQRFRYGVGKKKDGSVFHRRWTETKTESYEYQIKAAFCEAVGDGERLKSLPSYEGIVRMTTMVYFRIPKSGRNKWWLEYAETEEAPKTSKRGDDWDNYAKIICDALNGVAYYDDGQIATGIVDKRYSPNPRIEVELCYEDPMTKERWTAIKEENK